MKNNAPFYDPRQRLIEEVRRLEEDMRQLKYQQAPTIKLTGNVLVTFDIDRGPKAVEPELNPYHIINVRLTPPNNEVLFAVPEFSMFLHSHSATDAGYFPQGSQWDTAALDQYHNIHDLQYWYSWGQTNNRDIVASILMRREDYGDLLLEAGDENRDGTTPNTQTFDCFVRYRFILPGAGGS